MRMHPHCFALCIATAAAAGTPRTVPVNDGTLLQFFTDGIVRVVHAAPGETAASAVEKKASMMVEIEAHPPAPHVRVTETRTHITAATGTLAVVASKATGEVAFAPAGDAKPPLWRERGAAEFTPTTDMGAPAFKVAQAWEAPAATEGPPPAWYGGGEFQNGFANYANAPLQMAQFNDEAVIPFYVTTAGFGVLWDNNAWSYFNTGAQEEVAVASGGRASSSFTGEFTALEIGRHCFSVSMCAHAFGCGNADMAMVLTREGEGGGAITAVRWPNLANAPSALTGCVEIQSPGMYAVNLTTTTAATAAPRVYVTRPASARTTTLASDLGDLVDYYFVMGADRGVDAAIQGYRLLTGAAPLHARWVYGFWQCKEHYATQRELLDAAAEFRRRKIPVDAIVQDWHYWGDLGWGPQWDAHVYPDPKGMVAVLRSMNIHFMVSVWSKFDEQTTFYKQMQQNGWLLGTSNYYDPWTPAARELFYSFSKHAHFDIGVDALWLDATEPEFYPHANQTCGVGSANKVFNTYSLKVTQAIAEGLRRDYPEAQGARVFSLTRSSFAGQQRYGATLWSGDVTGNWDSLRRQVATSLNYQLSGMPHWAEDIGGFFRPSDQYTSPDYHRLLTRWFQVGAFTPVFRVHGSGSNTELWNYPEDVMDTIIASAINLRYRLLPYNYAGFARVAHEGYTMQRHLAFDFPGDARVHSVADEFMWGPAFLVAPVVSDGVSRRVYFPATPGGWVDFFNTSALVGAAAGAVCGDTLTLDVSDTRRFPLYVRAGSIVPLGPFVTYHDERPTAGFEIRVYPGADGAFTLYEDDGATSGYRADPPEAATIAFTWNDAARTLTIGARDGAYRAMPQSRLFTVVRCAGGEGSGVAEASAGVPVTYTGEAMTVRLA